MSAVLDLTEDDVEALRCVAGAQVAYDDGPGPTRLARGRAFVNRDDLARLVRLGLLTRRRPEWGSGVLVEITALGREARWAVAAAEHLRVDMEESAGVQRVDA